MKLTCEIEGCERKAHGRGWCRKHYMRWFHHGDPLAEVQSRRHYEPGTPCEIPGCERIPEKRGLCDMHYQRWKKYGDPLREPKPPTTECEIDGCEKPGPFAKGWCRMHYTRWQRHGDPLITFHFESPEEAIFANTTPEPNSGCLLWIGALSSSGYGTVRASGKRAYAHRYVWEQQHGFIPKGMDVDHACRTRACVNGDHLRLATRSQNNANRSGPNPSSASGYRNVYWDSKQKAWGVIVTKDGVQHRAGYYSNKHAAAEVARQLRRELYGEFAGIG